MTPTSIVAYLALFAAVGVLFVLASLLIGRFLRSQEPSPAKLEIYECGEPPIGPGFVQFDLRFYVVALLFIIFDVEIAFFFPWATVYGKAARLMDNEVSAAAPAADGNLALTDGAARTLQELGVEDPGLPPAVRTREAADAEIRQAARRLALAGMADIGVFFGVLMLGFAYVWRRGDLDWVRASGRPAGGEVVRRPRLGLAGTGSPAETLQQGRV